MIDMRFLSTVDALQHAYHGHYDPRLVAISVAIAVFASFSALETMQRLGHGRQGRAWIVLAALMLGVGVWAMHFIGMIAFQLNTEVSYDPWVTGLSMLPSIVASMLALLGLAKPTVHWRRLLGCALIMAAGVGAMHYAGMAAIRLDGVLRLDVTWFAWSLLAAVVLAVPALGLRSVLARYTWAQQPFWPSLLGGAVLGLAISSMHYLAMRSAWFIKEGGAAPVLAISPNTLAWVVGMAVLVLIFSGLLLMRVGSRIAHVKNRMHTILTATSQGYLMLDAQGLIVDHNPAMLRLLGCQASDLLGQPGQRWVPGLAGWPQGVFKGELTLTQSDGNKVPCLVHAGIMQDASGGDRFSFALFSDIRERVFSQKALAEQLELQLEAQATLSIANEEQRAIFEAASMGIALIRNRRIRRCNHKLEAVFGYAPGTMVGLSTRAWYVDDASFNAVGAALAQALEAGQTFQTECELQRRGTPPTRFWARLSVQMIDPRQPDLGWVGMVADISAEREAAVALRHAKEMAEEAARIKADFLANMSHEIRTPMNAIMGMSYLMLKTELNPRQQDYMHKIQRSSQHLLGVLNDILDFSKIEAGKLTVERIEFELEKVLDNVATLVMDKASAKGLELLFDLDPALPDYVVGDPMRLSQVLINYANNAIKFTSAGEIIISMRLQASPGPELWLYCAVRDTGIGLSEAQRAQLFQSFQQADTSTTRKYGGTGLGLAISKGLVEKMGGTVGVESRLDQGSTFWLRVPLGRSERQKRHLVPDPDLRGRKVLVVDDNAYARELLAQLLTSMSFVSEVCASGEEAVHQLQQAQQQGQAFALVLLDWQMPGLDGMETAKQILALGLQPPPVLLMVTAFGREDLLVQAQQVGVAEVLVKPVTASTLFDTAMRVLGGASRDSERTPRLAQPRSPLAAIRGAHVLLVEDHAWNEQVARELLQEAGLQVSVAQDGAQAVNMVLQQPFDLVLMDMQMPVLDGVGATLAIRQQPHLHNLPIVAMTANALPADRERCLAAGMNDHLPKPIDPERLWAALLRWIPARQASASIDSPPAPISLAPQAPIPLAPPMAEPSLPLGLNIQGLDVALGLRRVLGKTELYLNLLQRFVAEQQGSVAQLQQLWAAGDHASLERQAHSIKSITATLGAMAVSAQAAALESALRGAAAPAQCEACLAALAPALAQLLAEVAAALAAHAGASAPIHNSALSAPQREQVQALQARLQALLAEGNFEAVQLLQTEASLLEQAWGEGYAPLLDAVQHFDFETAQRCLQRMVAAPSLTQPSL